MATKRISRQEAQARAGVETSYERAQSFLEEHWKTAIVAVVVLLTVVAAGMLVTRSRESAEKRAHVYWLRAQQDLRAGEYASALEYASTLVDQHAGTPSGKRASLVRADALLSLGRAEESLRAYLSAAEVLASDPRLHTAARRGEAVALEQLGSHAESAAVYESLIAGGPRDGAAIYDFKNAARNRLRAGDREGAIALYERLVEFYGQDTDRVSVQEVHLARVAIAEIGYAREGSASAGVGPAS